MPTNRNQFNQLHAYLLDAADHLRAKCADHNSNGALSIRVTVDKYDGIEIKYTVGERTYSDGATGNELGAVMEEHFRRKGWEVANNARLLTPPIDSNDDNNE